MCAEDWGNTSQVSVAVKRFTTHLVALRGLVCTLFEQGSRN